MAETIKSVVSFKGELKFDAGKPDGLRRKLIDVIWLTNMGWTYNVELEEDLKTMTVQNNIYERE